MSFGLRLLWTSGPWQHRAGAYEAEQVCRQTDTTPEPSILCREPFRVGEAPLNRRQPNPATLKVAHPSSQVPFCRLGLLNAVLESL